MSLLVSPISYHCGRVSFKYLLELFFQLYLDLIFLLQNSQSNRRLGFLCAWSFTNPHTFSETTKSSSAPSLYHICAALCEPRLKVSLYDHGSFFGP